MLVVWVCCTFDCVGPQLEAVACGPGGVTATCKGGFAIGRMPDGDAVLCCSVCGVRMPSDLMLAATGMEATAPLCGVCVDAAMVDLEPVLDKQMSDGGNGLQACDACEAGWQEIADRHGL